MKAAEAKILSSAVHLQKKRSEPFFNKEREGNFFSKSSEVVTGNSLPAPASKPLPNQYAIEDCSAAYEAEIRDAIDGARRKLTEIANAIVNPGSNVKADTAFGKFFGSNSAVSIADKLLTIGKSLESVSIECEDPGNFLYDFFCPPSTIAYTRQITAITGYGNVHVCEPQFHNLTRAQKIGTIVHEGAHRYIDATGETYYTIDCVDTKKTLAMIDSDRYNNADCFACLIQELV